MTIAIVRSKKCDCFEPLLDGDRAYRLGSKNPSKRLRKINSGTLRRHYLHWRREQGVAVDEAATDALGRIERT